VRVGDTVRRTPYPWQSAIHALLLHLESVGYPHSPRFLGMDEQGREVLTYIDGVCGGDGYLDGIVRGAEPWAMVVPEEGLRRMARFLRDYHDAVEDYRPNPGSAWAGGQGLTGEVICHNDPGPWNIVWRDGFPVGIIDWDLAAPGRRLHDVAYALEWVAPFCSDEECLRWRRFEHPPDRSARIEVFAEAYGLSTTAGLVDEVIEQQMATLELALGMADVGLEPQATWAAEGMRDSSEQRIEWTRSNRHLFAAGGT